MWKSVKFRGFVNSELQEKDKKELRKLLEDLNWLYNTLGQLVLANYEVKISYDSKLFAYRCIVFGDINSNDSGLAVSGLGGDVEKAIAVAVYKATVINKPNEWPEAQQRYGIEL